MTIQNYFSFVESSIFWSGFWSNFLSDLLITIVIGIFITKRLHDNEKKAERKEKEREERIKKEEKTISYLNLLRNEINNVIILSETYFQEIQRKKYGGFILFTVDYWEILKYSGEIPRWFEPSLIEFLTIIYSAASQINEINRRYNAMDLAERSIRSDLISEETAKLQSIRSIGNPYLEEIDKSIMENQKSLDLLKKSRNK
jgi:hypothetical protein